MRIPIVRCAAFLAFALLAAQGRAEEEIVFQPKTRAKVEILSCTEDSLQVRFSSGKVKNYPWRVLDPACAIDIFQRYADHPSNLDLGRFCLKLGQTGRASAFFAQALKKDPSLAEEIDRIKQSVQAASATRTCKASALSTPSPRVSPKRRTKSTLKARRRGKFWHVETTHFIVRTEYGSKATVRFARDCEQLYNRFTKVFRMNGQSVWKKKLRVYVFADRNHFVIHALKNGFTDAPRAGGYFHRHGDDIYVSIAPVPKGQSEERLRCILVHELGHAFLEYYYKSGPVYRVVSVAANEAAANVKTKTTILIPQQPIPSWVHEGVAQHFEYLHAPNMPNFVAAIQFLRSSPPSLAEIRRVLTLREIPPTDITAYRISWGFTEYLLDIPGGRFASFVRLLKDGVPEQEAFRRSFGVSRATMARRWLKRLSKRS